MNIGGKCCTTVVLVVDDDPAIRDSLQILLEAHGMDVQTFHSGPDFLERCDREDVACLVLDIQMPVMSGFDLLKKLSADGRSLPTIMISSLADPQTRNAALQAGAVDLLEKPFDTADLVTAILKATSQPGSGAGRLAT